MVQYEKLIEIIFKIHLLLSIAPIVFRFFLEERWLKTEASSELMTSLHTGIGGCKHRWHAVVENFGRRSTALRICLQTMQIFTLFQRPIFECFSNFPDIFSSIKKQFVNFDLWLSQAHTSLHNWITIACSSLLVYIWSASSGKEIA